MVRRTISVKLSLAMSQLSQRVKDYSLPSETFGLPRMSYSKSSRESTSPISEVPTWETQMSYPLINITLPILKRSIQFIFPYRLLSPPPLATPSWLRWVCLQTLDSLLSLSISSIEENVIFSCLIVSIEISFPWLSDSFLKLLEDLAGAATPSQWLNMTSVNSCYYSPNLLRRRSILS